MLQEAIEFVYDAGKDIAEADKAGIFNVPGDGRTVVIEHKGTLIDRPVPPPLRAHKVDSVGDLIAAAKKWNPDPTIWINGTKIVLVIDDADRRELVTLSLVKSAVFAKLESLATNGNMDQANLVRLLRREFRGAISQPEILAAVRRIKFKLHTEGHSSIQHGNESLGQQIENEITGAGDLPETMVVPTNVFNNPGEHDHLAQVGLDLEVDAQSRKFLLRPMPDEIELAIDGALDDIRKRIEKGAPGVAVFFGTP